MAIAYIDPSTNEPVEKERWRWVCVYTDGTQLEQFAIEPGKGAVFHKFADIDTDRVACFRLVHDTHAPVVIYPPRGAKLVHGYSTRVAQRLTGDGEHVYSETYRAYKFGYQLDGRDHGVLVDHDDSVIIINDFNAVIVARDIKG